jgi:Domain of unknown function (DU1801)
MQPDQLFRLNGAVHRDPEIDIWLSRPADELRRMAQPWFEHMRDCGADVRELMHDGCPVACVQDAPFGYVNTFRDHVSVGFFHGATLDDPAGLLEGTGKHMRHVKLRWGEAVDTAAMTGLVTTAYQDIRLRLAATA